jgi:hypothetical protein
VPGDDLRAEQQRFQRRHGVFQRGSGLSAGDPVGPLDERGRGGGLDCDVTVYRRVGTAVGFETNPAAWTQVATATGPSSPIDTPSQFGLSNFVTLNANTVYGFAIQLSTSGTNEGHAYTNATTLNTLHTPTAVSR